MSRRKNGKQNRFSDVHKIGVGDGTVLKVESDWKMRHELRWRAAQSSSMTLATWCDERGIGMEMTNRGEHFHFYMDSEMVAEWWPRTAKFVVYKRYKEGIHVHNWLQVKLLLDVLADHHIGPTH